MGYKKTEKNMQSIVEISNIVTSARDFFSIKDKVINKMLEVIPPKKACVNIFRNNNMEYSYLVCKDTLAKIPKLLELNIKPIKDELGIKLPLTYFPDYIKESVEEKKIIYIHDVFTDKRAEKEREIAKSEGYKSRIVFPLISSDKVNGFMTCLLEEGEVLSEEDIAFVSSVASLLGLSMEITDKNKDIEGIIRKLRNAILSIGKSTDKLNENDGLSSYLKMIAEDMAKLTKSKGSLIIIDGEENLPDNIYSFGDVALANRAYDFVKYYEKTLMPGETPEKMFGQGDLPEEFIKKGIQTLTYETIIKDEKSIGYIIIFNSSKYYIDDLRILGIYSTQVLLSIYMYFNNRKIIETSMMDRDLELISQQQKMIMADEMIIDDENLEVDYLNIPSKYVGGDFCKFDKLSEGRYVFFVADVMGHGLLSNYFVAMMKGVLKSILRSFISPSDTLQRLNAILFSDLDKANIFITAKLMYFDFNKNEVITSNAGHTLPIIIYNEHEGKRRHCLIKSESALALGIMEDTTFYESKNSLKDVNLIAMYTDGIVETKNKEKEEYGTTRLVDYLKRSLSENNEKVCKDLNEDLIKFRGSTEASDDIMIVTVKIK